MRSASGDGHEKAVVEGKPRSGLAGVWRRIVLTYQYHGLASVLYRAVTFPLRFTPLKPMLRLEPRASHDRSAITAWYRTNGRPVTIVIPSFRDAPRVAALVKSIRRTTDPKLVRIVVADDASGAEHVAALRRIQGIQVVAGQTNAGFAANVNRGLAAAQPGHDVVVLNSDVVARRGWLASLQFAASQSDDIGVVGGKLLYDGHKIQSAGTIRHPDHPEWFDHRYRFAGSNNGPANVPMPVLAVTGACMYIKRPLIEDIGSFDEAYPMAYEDVDYCLRAWQAGYTVWYTPQAEMLHLESITRGSQVGERERRSQQIFWDRWGEFFDARNVRTPDGVLRVVYVTEGTGVGGGHRDIFEHLNRLLDRGHEVELWTLGPAPDWFDLRAPVRTFADYERLTEALEPLEAIKVATWWNTAASVWRASVLKGIPVYFVQDIETSYYPDDPAMRDRVLASYRHEFRYMTISSWNRRELEWLGLRGVTLIPPGIDLETFHPRADVAREDSVVLALGRSNPLKNFPLTLAAWRGLPEPRPELRLFGIEPDLAGEDPGIRYVTAPSDEEVARLFNEATVFVQTSTHEGFCLPALEAMASGCAVVTTDAHGNRDFCHHDSNCLVADPRAESVTDGLLAVLQDRSRRERLGAAGVQTAAEYAWSKRIDALEAFLAEVAEPRRIEPSTEATPELRRAPAR